MGDEYAWLDVGVPTRYPEATTVPLEGRRVTPDQFAKIPGAWTFDDFVASLPAQWGAADLTKLVWAILEARATNKAVILMLGGHVIKCGLGPLIRRLMREHLISHVAMNGAAAIHDFEIARFGQTSEDVQAGLDQGTFGMAEETGREMAEALVHPGLGESWVQYVAQTPGHGRQHSVFMGAATYHVPVTVHVGIGTDIVHQHPRFDGRIWGEKAALDFRRLSSATCGLHDGGVVLNWGSAVIMPEVFVKAVNLARNLYGEPFGFAAADFDMQRHYRPTLNVLQRPTTGGWSAAFTGQHELLLPFFCWRLLRAAE